MATFIGAFPGAMGPLLGWTAARGRIEWPGVALFAILFVWQFPHFMSIAWLYRDDYARAGIRMLPVVQPDGWSTVARGALLRRAHDSRQPGALAAGRGRPDLCRAGHALGLVLPGLHHPLRPHPARPDVKTKAACWRAICSRSASSTCPCSSPRSCSAPPQSTKEAMTDRMPRHSKHRAPPSPPFLLVSAAATAFLFWLIYVHPAAASSSAVRLSARAQRAAQRPQRHRLADRLHLHPRAAHSRPIARP